MVRSKDGLVAVLLGQAADAQFAESRLERLLEDCLADFAQANS
jgi:hypothetical protein